MKLLCKIGMHHWGARLNDSPRVDFGYGVNLYWVGGGLDKVLCTRCGKVKPYYGTKYDHLPELIGRAQK